jgi:hypothetical protein
MRPTPNVLKRDSSEKKKTEQNTPRAHSSQTHTLSHTRTHTTLGIVIPFHDSSSESALSGSAGDRLRVQQQVLKNKK